MKLIGEQALIKLGKEIQFSFLNSGDIYQILYQHNQINMYRGNLIDGGHSNIYLAVKNEGVTKLIGVSSPSTFSKNGEHVTYRGSFLEIDYQLDLIISRFGWRYKFRNLNKTSKDISLIYVQDVGLADVNSILNSEAYTAQYLDHQFKNQVLTSTQNQGVKQFLKFSSNKKIESYATDGLDFFGLGYKYSGIPDYLYKDLPSRSLQGEYAYIALKTQEVNLDKVTEIDFIVSYNDHEVTDAYLEILPKVNKKPHQVQLLNGNKPKESSFSGMLNPEYKEGLLSYFTVDHAHVVLQSKELIQERSTGTMILAGDFKKTTHLMSSTTWMNGIFNSHVVLGNTSFNKFLSVNRNQLVPSALTGQRIWIKLGGNFKLLNVPSYYEMGLNYSKWVYELDYDTLEIITYTELNQNKIHLSFKSLNQKTYELILTNQILLNTNEDASMVEYITTPDLTFKPAVGSLMASVSPNIRFILESSDYELAKLFELDLPGIIALKYQTDSFDVTIIGVEGVAINEPNQPFEASKLEVIEVYKGLINHLEIKGDESLNRYNHLLYWYTHNALIHYAQPHGLEQYNGAAWGTRDVCQGSLELFMTFGQFDQMKQIILMVFENQYYSQTNPMDGDFPQWFMFDQYYKIRAQDSHADIIVWPLLALGEYLERTNDQAILDEVVPYIEVESMEKKYPEAIKHHVRRLLNNLKRNQMKHTSLPKYGGGDWNDTLQPANSNLTESLVSGWTSALLYQALDVLSLSLKVDTDLIEALNQYKEALKKDYLRYIYQDKHPAGFLQFEDKTEVMFHPNESSNGLKYRLIAYNQAITSRLVPLEDIKHLNKTVETYLKGPDGYRLMEKPVQYQGGQKSFFQRAETATNFGREIGIMYVHAHLRRIEALLQTGEANQAYWALNVVNPIKLNDYLSTAKPRQSNTYFSSSDANFINRYEAQEQYDKVKNNKIEFKGGWRIYSSGPGIYLNQLISNFLGLQIHQDKLTISPAIPKDLNGLEVRFKLEAKDILVSYIHSDVKYLNLNGVEFKPTYDTYLKPVYQLSNNLLKDTNTIKIYY